MEPVQPIEPAPTVEAKPAEAAPVEAAPAVETPAGPETTTVEVTEAAAPVEPFAHSPRVYPSLYDSTGTTIAAVFLGICIVASIQALVLKLYSASKGEHIYLTRFVTAMVALIVGAYLADLLIAGPDTSLLSDADHTLILTFLKDTCLMVFSYYFGLKAQAPRED